MPLFSHPDFDGHERILFAHDAETGLEAVIAIHSTRLGPAAGGCRMWPYETEDEAVADALRLSRGMTYKNAVAGLDIGGGKAVIIADPRTDKTPALMRAFGRAVHDLGGRYVTAEDVGMTVSDMEIVREVTPYVAGLETGPHASGDPSPVTARGVFEGMRKALLVATVRPESSSDPVAVQGLGHVGRHLCTLLHAAGASLVVSDIDPQRVADAQRAFDARVVAPGEIASVPADVYAPCALGGVLDDASIPRLGARIVAGAANNQLARPEHAEALHARGILYVPDFALNAGGIINVTREIERRTDALWLTERLEAMVSNLEAILREAAERNVSPNGVAETFARRRLA